jgi:hypothetical protein
LLIGVIPLDDVALGIGGPQQNKYPFSTIDLLKPSKKLRSPQNGPRYTFVTRGSRGGERAVDRIRSPAKRIGIEVRASPQPPMDVQIGKGV